MYHAARTEGETEELGARLRARVRPARHWRSSSWPASSVPARRRWFAVSCAPLGVAGSVRSPTYTLVELYAVAQLTVVHADLYRLRDPSELDSLGLRDWAQPGYLWLIEWPERGAGHLPAPDLTVRLSVGGAAHEINLAAHSELGRHWLQELQRG